MLTAPSTPPAFGRALVIGGLAASLISITVASAALASRKPAPATIDPCAINFDLGALSAKDRSLVARRSLACSDVTAGRITAAEYRQQVAAIDAAWTTPAAPVPPPAAQWATSVRGVSSQYATTSWAADKVLGAPDVFPAHGDLANAWASLGADDKDEWIEVGYAQPMQIGALEVFETYNPGAITSIDMITTSGRHISAYQGSPASTGQTSNKLHVDVGCTAEPIAAVRIQLASTRVTGWNELDAIGVLPCSE